MAGIILCDTAPEVTERAGLFVVEMTSGDDKIRVALTQRDICVLATRSMEAVDALARQRQAAVVSLRTSREGR